MIKKISLLLFLFLLLSPSAWAQRIEFSTTLDTDYHFDYSYPKRDNLNTRYYFGNVGIQTPFLSSIEKDIVLIAFSGSTKLLEVMEPLRYRTFYFEACKSANNQNGSALSSYHLVEANSSFGGYTTFAHLYECQGTEFIGNKERHIIKYPDYSSSPIAGETRYIDIELPMAFGREAARVLGGN